MSSQPNGFPAARGAGRNCTVKPSLRRRLPDANDLTAVSPLPAVKVRALESSLQEASVNA